jgi:chromosome segregation protein
VPSTSRSCSPTPGSAASCTRSSGRGSSTRSSTPSPRSGGATSRRPPGILKHRRRRERALRKLEQVDQHIDKLQTVLRELRRQLRPLERQAEAADRYQALQAELRDVRIRLAAASSPVSSAWPRPRVVTTRRRPQRSSASKRARPRRERTDAMEAELADLGPAAEQAGETYYALTSLAERLQGTADLVEAKRRHLVEYVDEPLAGRPPAELRAQADRVEADANDRAAERERERASSRGTDGRREAEQTRRAHEQARQADQRRRGRGPRTGAAVGGRGLRAAWLDRCDRAPSSGGSPRPSMASTVGSSRPPRRSPRSSRPRSASSTPTRWT